jgi:mannosyl-3-phosphoglycerate phosphatase
MRKVPFVTFVDIDAAPAPTGESRAPMSDLLETLAQERIMLVFISQRTRAQLESTRQALGVFHPFVCEGGAAAFVPERYFGSDLENARKVGGYQAIEFAAPYESAVDKLRRASDRLGIGILGFNDMSVELVARECGLTLLEAHLAKLREYAEPFRLLCANPVAERRLFRAVESTGLTCRRGEPFHTVCASSGPRPAIDVLTTLYRLAFGKIVTAAMDEGSGATDIVPFVDVPLATGPQKKTQSQRDSGAPCARAWLESLIEQVQFCRDARVVTYAARQAR